MVAEVTQLTHRLVTSYAIRPDRSHGEQWRFRSDDLNIVKSLVHQPSIPKLQYKVTVMRSGNWERVGGGDESEFTRGYLSG